MNHSHYTQDLVIPEEYSAKAKPLGITAIDGGSRSNIESLPSNASDDLIGLSDIRIMKVGDPGYLTSKNPIHDLERDERYVPTLSKPQGSAYISVKMSIGTSTQLVMADLCVDTGSDFTICDSTFLKAHFGKDALKHLTHPEKLPKLRSATGHNLEMLGVVKGYLFLGEYKLTISVLVYKGSMSVFLLGSDAFYDRLIYDRGMYIAFPEDICPPIPIKYELAKKLVQAVRQSQIPPRSSAVVPVQVTTNSRLTGKEVLLTPVSDLSLPGFHPYKDTPNILIENETPVRNTVSVIDSLGKAFVLVENDTDDILTILPNFDIAFVELIQSEEGNVNLVNLEIDQDKTNSLSKDGQWPISALKNELIDKIPSNVIVQWDKIQTKNACSLGNESPPTHEHNINYVHDKVERKHLLDGTGEGFPIPPSADSVHPDQDLDTDPEAWLKGVEHSHLTDMEWTKLKVILLRNKDAFSKSKTEIGCCNYFKVSLPLKPGTGYMYNKPRPLPFKHREMASETISELLAKGVIRPSKSPHATNIVCVKKKTMNGVVSHRICCDLRQVNENSIPNRFPNYWIEDAMAKIQGAAYRTAMDFKDAFHMLVLSEESIPVTAFYFNNVLFEYVRVPFGHVCAMNAFCCLMALLCVGYEPSSYYADDLMITTKADHQSSKDQLFDLHLEHIQGMLQRIVEAGLKLVAHKCQWCYSSDKPMEWLGFTMENNLLKPQESKCKAMRDFPVPTSGKQVLSFISTASFYRRFIKNFAKEVLPMYPLAYQEPFLWTPEAQVAFDRVKDIMCSDLVLRLPRQGELFQIYSDASAGALGVVLCQIDPIDKKSHPCAYGSRKFNDCELKLSIPCKELLAIVYGLNLWSFYICGNPIQVFSDCRAWTFLKMQSGNSGKISRLALLVSEYDISISYIKGSLNKAADGLSRAWDDGLTKYDDQVTARHPALELLQAPELKDGEVMKLNDYLTHCEDYLSDHWPKVLKEYESQLTTEGQTPDMECFKPKVEKPPQRLSNFDKDVLHEHEYVNQVIQEAAILHIDRSKIANWDQRFGKDKIYPFQVNEDYISEGFESLNTDEVDLSDSESESIDNDLETTDSSFKSACFNIRLIAINESCFSVEAFTELQSQDEFCSHKLELIKKKDSRVKSAGYFLKRNILMRQMQTKDMQTYSVICVPQVLVKPLLESSHRSLMGGHFGSNRYLLNMKSKYYWSGMREDILQYHQSCLPCQYNDKYPIKYESGYVIRPLWPMHIVHCDLIVGLPKALDGSYAILLLYDGFSRLTYGIPLASEKADYVVKKLMSHFVAAYGLPWALHSDNGRNVDGALIRHLALMLGVLKTSTPPYTPNANPTETMCGAVSMLLRKALSESDRRYWSLCLPFVLNALNSTVHTATGYTPNSLFFGRYKERDPVPLIPFDAESANVNEYFQKMRRFQELAFQIVRARNERKLIARKETWDTTAKVHTFREGDFVLVKDNSPAPGPGMMKLRSKYIGPFRVIKAYTASLIVVPWTENDRLDEYYKDPDVFRLLHRGDIKPFYTRQVAVKHCKPFKGDIKSEQVIDPIMLTRFLDMLGVDSGDDLLSVIDPDRHNVSVSGSSNSSDPGPPSPPRRRPTTPGPPNGNLSDSDDSDDVPRPVTPQPLPVEDEPVVPQNPVAVQVPVAVPVPVVPANLPLAFPENLGAVRRRINQNVREQLPNPVDALVDDLRLPHIMKETLRDYYNKQADLPAMQAVATNYHNRIKELEYLAQDPDPFIRDQAEQDLQEVMDHIKIDVATAGNGSSSSSSSSSANKTIIRPKSIDQASDPENDSLQLLPPDIDDHVVDDLDLEWDHERPIPGSSNETQEVHIRMPNVDIHVRPFNAPTLPERPRTIGRGQGSRRSYTGLTPRDLHNWLDQVELNKGTQPTTPVTTRSGRTIRTPARYDPEEYNNVQRGLRDMAKAIELSKLEAEQAESTRAQEQKEDGATALPPGSARTQESDPFKKSSKMARD